MEDSIYDKVERRDILAKIDYWNFGLLPNGKVASVPCFVLESVPDIKLLKSNKELLDEISPIATKSEWTKNLVKSHVYYKHTTDNSTLSSLSLCKAIFKDDPAFKFNTDTIHYMNNHPKAYIEMGKIARLTGEFEEELKIAEEHWPSHPRESWDKLCQIWYKYGFLWPEYVYLDHSPDYNIIWRTHLRPIYEFFPVTYYKEFIMNMIYTFTGCILNGKTFRLKNMKTGNYLQKQNDHEIATGTHVQQEKKNNKVWTFQDKLEPTLKYQTPYMCAGSKKIICSTGDQSDLIELSIISNSNNKDGHIKLINYHIPINTPFNKIYIDSQWQWTVQSFDTFNTSNKMRMSNTFNLDHLIDQHQCLKYHSTILLSQASLYLCELDTSQLSSNINSPVYNQILDDSFVKPPSSISTTNRDLFNFSAISESNSTQPTIDSDKSKQYNHKKQQPHTAYPCLRGMKKPTEEYQWKVELPENETIYASYDLASAGADPQTLMISPLLPLTMNKHIDIPFKSKWLDGNDKLYNLNTENTSSRFMQNNNIAASPSSHAESIQSIPSDTSIPIISEKKLGKQPLRKEEESDSSDSEWTASPSSSLSSTPKNKVLTEAERFKLQVQQEFNEKDALMSIYNNVMLNTATPMSNTTSQIQYYDEDELRTYTMTPKSRYNTPTSTANLTPEEQSLRKKSRETSFMLLAKQESKQEIFMRAMEKSSLNNWIRAIASPTTSKPTTTAVAAAPVDDISMLSAEEEDNIPSNHYGNNAKTIQKKKSFYQVNNNNNRASKSITM